MHGATDLYLHHSQGMTCSMVFRIDTTTIIYHTQLCVLLYDLMTTNLARANLSAMTPIGMLKGLGVIIQRFRKKYCQLILQLFTGQSA